MTSPRTYGDPCGIARALDAVGERWALLIVRELRYGPKRFTDLRAGLGEVSANVLSQRLSELQAAGVVRQVADGGPRYALTEWGDDLGPILVELGRWGARSPKRPTGDLSVDALLVALESTYEHNADLEATIELRLDGATYCVELDPETIVIRREQARRPDAVITTEPAVLRALVFGDRKLSDTNIQIDGSRPLARRFLRSFRRPEIVRRDDDQAAP